MNNTFIGDDWIVILGEKTSDIFSFGISQIIKILGIIANIINIIIFTNSKFKDQIYIYLRAHSFADVLYLTSILICDQAFVIHFLPSTFVKSHFVQITGLYLCNYFTSCLAIFNILIELIVSSQRFLILINARHCKSFENKIVYLILTFVFTLSLIVYLQEIIFFQIYPINGLNGTNKSSVAYEIRTNDIGLKYEHIYYTLSLSIQMFRGPLCLILMVIINSLTWHYFRKYLTKKSRILGGKSFES
jgi:hypothetical protein